MVVLFWVTNGAVNVYEQFLFSTHMLGHMVLTMAIPVLLVLSAPVTLGLRAIAKRTDGSRGAREWILLLVHSRFATVITNPIVTGGLFARRSGSSILAAVPLGDRRPRRAHLDGGALPHHGYLFVADPGRHRPGGGRRRIRSPLLLLATMAFHAFFGSR
jgi:putative copper resistance protein D